MRDRSKILILSLVFIVVYIYAFDSKIDLNGDNCNYMRLAQHMAQGDGYSNYTPDGYQPASHYPPGYSFFLSIFMFIGVKSLIFFKALNGLLLLASILILYKILYSFSGNWKISAVASIATILSPNLQHFSNIVMSEMLYLFCTVVVIFSLYRYSLSNNLKGKYSFIKSTNFYIAIFAAVAAYYIRTVGSSIMGAIVIFYLFRREWYAAFASILGMIILIIPWSIRNSIFGIESRYLGTIMTVNPWRPEEGTISTFGEMFSKMVTNIDETVIKGFVEMLFPIKSINYSTSSTSLAILFSILIVAIIIYGAWRIKPLRWTLLAFFGANIALFALWHGGNSSRYVVPIAPYIFFLFYYGLYSLIVDTIKMIRGRENLILGSLLLIASLSISPLSAQAARAKLPFSPGYQNYFNMAQSIDKSIPKSSVICCRKVDLFNYFAPENYAVNYSYTLDKKALIQDLLNKNVDYVILDQLGFSSTARYLFPAIKEYPSIFKPISRIENPDTYLFVFDKEEAKRVTSDSSKN